ncbi:30S ribosomal protein S8 [Pseudomonadota bacterium]
MAFNHSVSYLVSCLKNGQMAKRKMISCDSSKLKKEILNILKEEGFIQDYKENLNDSKKSLEIKLKYHLSKPVINDIKVISKPGKRVYCGVSEIPSVYNGLGMVVLSTPRGVLADYKAKELNVGGELLLKIF